MTLTPELKELCEKNDRMGILDYLWNTKYVPYLEAEIQRETAARSDAFAEGITFTCCDEELRLMTPGDLVQLDGMDNALVVGGREPTYGDLAYFLWYLNKLNDPSTPIRTAYRKGKFTARLRNLLNQIGAEECYAEVYEYLDRIFIDLPPPKTTKPNGEPIEQKPPAVHCVAPLLVDVAAVLGPFDPMTGRTLGVTPIPRLIQYQRAHNRASGNYTSLDSCKSRCLEDLNNIMAEFRKG